MVKSFDLKLIEFKEQLVNTINGSQLPLSCVQYVLGEMMQIIGNTIEKNISDEKQQLSKKKETSDVKEEE